MPAKLTPLLVLLFCLHPWVSNAQEDVAFPRMPVDAKTLRVQDQAEEVYKRTDYERAFFIYRNELVPIGDKYGQYMVGFMYLTGKGVAEDPVAASAWYRLAAERGIVEFDKARNKLMTALNEEQRARSDKLFIELRKQYGDLALLLRAIRADYEVLRSTRTGSRLSADSNSLAIINPGSGSHAGSGTDYFRKVRERSQARLEYIAAKIGLDVDEINLETMDLDLIEKRVDAYLETLD